jgi:SAM-dependent methyltransferase
VTAEGSFNYVGSELTLFRQARTWKDYWSSQIRPFVAGTVLEVGAGLGANSDYLAAAGVSRLVRLEPDPSLASQLAESARAPEARGTRVEDRVGTLQTCAPNELFQTILYIDVLEHIADDRSEIALAARHLAREGHLVVLAPAFQALYSPYDRAIGHYRRYTAAGLRRLTPASLRVVTTFYLDGPGALLSFGNRALLRRTSPTETQIAFWDRCIVPIARVTDIVTRRLFGRSVVCVWKLRD